ncbi:MAG: hypothetical protein ABI700_25420 [Chloroflexota bacterium]
MPDPLAFPHIYTAYGLVIRANRPIDYLLSTPEALNTDILIDFVGDQPLDVSAAPVIKQTAKGRAMAWRLPEGGLCTRVPLGRDYIQVVVDSAGRSLRVAQSPTLQPEHVAHYLIGSGMGIALRVRGLLCLHASVVAYRDHAFLLMGSKGAGKSTTCAALADLGAHPMSDDIAALSRQGAGFQVAPAYPYIRLRPEVASAIYSDSALTEHIWAIRNVTLVDKRYLNLEANGLIYQRDPLPVAAIYALDARLPTLEAPEIQPVNGVNKLQMLTKHGVARELFSGQQTTEFAQLAALANTIPLRRVVRSDDLASVPRIAAAILADVTSLIP